MNNDLKALARKDPLPLLKSSWNKQTSEEKKELLDDPDFFLSMVENYAFNRMDMINFFLQEGLDLTLTGGQCEVLYDFRDLDKTLCTTYLKLWRFVGDDTLVKLTQHLGQDYILALEKQHVPLLNTAYRNTYPNTVKLLTSYGLTPENATNGKMIESLVQYNDVMRNLYLDINSQHNPDTSYDLIKKVMDKLTIKIRSKNDKIAINEVLEHISKHVPTLSKNQQEEIIASTVTSGSISLYKNAIKNISPSAIKYQNQIEFFPPWLNLNKTQHIDFLIHFLDTQTPLDSYSHHTSYIDVLSKAFSSLKISLYKYDRQYDHFKGTEKSLARLTDHLKPVISPDFWLQSDTHNNNHPYFLQAVKNFQILNSFASSWLNFDISKLKTFALPEVKKEIDNQYPNALYETNYHNELGFSYSLNKYNNDKFDDKQLKILKTLLERTWFYQDENNVYAIEHAFKTAPFLINTKLDEKFSQYLAADINSEIFTLERKKILFNNLIECSGFSTQTFNHLWQEVKNNDIVDLTQLDLKNSTYLDLKNRKPALYEEILKTQFKQRLDCELSPAIEHIIPTKKIKI